MKNFLSFLSVIMVLVFSTGAFPEGAQVRQWKDRRGKVLAEGSLVESKADTILLKTKDGKIVELSKEDLRSTDKRYVKHLIFLQEIRQKAEEEDDQAMLLLGHAYYFGKHVTQDDKRAFELYELAKDKGNVKAMHALAIMYENGFGVEKDLAQAFMLYKKAGNGGVAASSVRAGLMRFQGLGDLPLDLKAAAGWFGQGARNGDVQGMFLIGMAWKNGQGVQRHAEMAEKWLKKASDAGYTPATVELADFYRHLRNYSHTSRIKRLSATELVKLYEKAARKGNANAMFQLGYYYERNHISQSKAIRWYRASAKLGSGLAQYALGQIYMEGQGLRKNEKKAFELILLSANNKNIPNKSASYFALHHCYRDGKGVKKDPVKARHYLNLRNYRLC